MKLLIIDDQPHFLCIENWDYYKLGDDVSWDVISHPDNIPTDLSAYDAVLLDHNMPKKNGDVVCRDMVLAGFPANRIVSISAMTQPGYPDEVNFVGKNLNSRVVKRLIAYFRDEIPWDDVRTW